MTADVAANVLNCRIAFLPLAGRSFRAENGCVAVWVTSFFYGPLRPSNSQTVGVAWWALHCCRCGLSSTRTSFVCCPGGSSRAVTPVLVLTEQGRKLK